MLTAEFFCEYMKYLQFSRAISLFKTRQLYRGETSHQVDIVWHNPSTFLLLIQNGIVCSLITFLNSNFLPVHIYSSDAICFFQRSFQSSWHFWNALAGIILSYFNNSVFIFSSMEISHVSRFFCGFWKSRRSKISGIC